MSVPTRRILEPIFGEPTLLADNNGDAVWARGAQAVATHQKSGTGWVANLYGGVQSAWNDWAAVYVPVSELRLTDLNSALWTWYNTEAESFGLNMVIWIHDPNDNDKRAEMTQQADIATLEKAAGWNAHELNIATDQFYFYGEGTTGTGLTAGPPNYYGLDDFQADVIFGTWTIYRISFEYGWQTGDNEFKNVWVADIKINGQVIQLKPDSGGTGRIGHRHYTVADTASNSLTPYTPFRLLSIDCEISAAGTTSESLTITKNAGMGDTYDVLLYTVNTLTGSTTGGTITALFVPFGEGYDFTAWDVLDMAWGNTQDRTLGFTWTYQTVF